MLLAANYTFLDAEERQVSGAQLVREIRRPRHSANLIAAGRRGRLSWGASAAWVGERLDVDFDRFPAERVTLGDYLLASLRVALHSPRHRLAARRGAWRRLTFVRTNCCCCSLPRGRSSR
jgi:vitamin B12 transporter